MNQVSESSASYQTKKLSPSTLQYDALNTLAHSLCTLLGIDWSIAKEYPHPRKLAKMSEGELLELPQMTKKRAQKLQSALTLGVQALHEPMQYGESFTCSVRVARSFRAKLALLDHEQMWVILLDSQCRVIKELQISMGTSTKTSVDGKTIFHAAIKENANAIILIHNHPSGACQPSQEDRQLTKQVQEAGNLLNIKLLDHIIIAQNTHYSFCDNGLI